jgi:hypothetical protein
MKAILRSASGLGIAWDVQRTTERLHITGIKSRLFSSYMGVEPRV